MKIYSKQNRTKKWQNEKSVKVICTHCGKKQTVKEIDYSLNDVACKFCKKEGELVEI